MLEQSCMCFHLRYYCSGRGPSHRGGHLALAPMFESSLTYNIYITVDLLCVDTSRAMPPLDL